MKHPFYSNMALKKKNDIPEFNAYLPVCVLGRMDRVRRIGILFFLIFMFLVHLSSQAQTKKYFIKNRH